MGHYTGHVEARGAPAERRLTDLIVTKMSVGPMDNNAYLLQCRRTGEQLLIDAADDADRILGLIRQSPADGPGAEAGAESGGTPALTGIVTTHRHPDHWQALAAVRAATSATTLAGSADAAHLPVDVDRPLEHGDTIEVGRCALGVIGLRGHTPGSIAVLYRDPHGTAHLFTGDSLFPGGVGRTGSAADFDSLMDDVTARVFGVLPDDTWVYPGHGDDTTLGAERPHLPEWRARGW